MPSRRRARLHSPAVRRMPAYLHWLLRMRELGRRTVSTTELADGLGVGWTAVRKDIALTGVVGRPRVGYDVDRLVAAIRAFLGWKERRRAALFGAGALGTALLGCGGLVRCGLDIESVFDADPAKAGLDVRGRTVRPLSDLPEALRADPPEIAILCVPASAAQSAADLAVRGGVRCLWNFSDAPLDAPPGVVVQNESVAGGFAALSVKLDNRPPNLRP